MNAALEGLRFHAPVLVILAPLIACVLAGLSPSGRGAWIVASVGAIAAAGLAILVAARFDGAQVYQLGGWPAPLGVALRIDGLGAYALAVIATIAALAIVSALGALRDEVDRARQPLAASLTMGALAGAMGLIVAGDLFVLFVFLQWIWIALAALVGLGVDRDRRAGPAALTVLTLGSVGALLFAFGAGFVFLAAGAFDMGKAAGVLNAAEHARSAAAGLALMALGTLMAAGLAPLNAWAIGAFGRGPSFVSLALGAVIPAAGAVAAGRMMALAASATAPGLAAGLSAGFSALGVVGVLIASVQAIAATDFRRMTVYVIAAQAGCVLIGFSAASAAGIAGALFHLANQAVAALGLFCAAAALRGARDASTPLSALDGLFRRAPFLSLVIAVTMLSLIGAPMTAGFLSRWSLLQATLEARIWWGGAAIILSSLAAVAYAGRVFDRMFLRAPLEGAAKPRIVSVAPALILAAAATLAFGFNGAAPLHAAEAAAGSLNWGRAVTADILLIVFLIAPISHVLAVALAAPFGVARDTINIVFSIIYALLAFALVGLHWEGEQTYAALARPLPTADFAFSLEPLGLTVAATLTGLAALNAPFAAGYFRAMKTASPTRAQIFIALSIGMAAWAALAANLFTFLLCYQALAALSFPLVGHDGSSEARKAGRIYLGVLLAASFGLLLPAMVWTHALAGRLDFVAGGLLAGKIGPIEADILLGLFAFGFSAVALIPLHAWLPAAMRAPTPAAGLVHAVAVPSIGALGLVKTSLLIFGSAMDQAVIARPVLLGIALGGAGVATLIALSKDELKARLAYSTIAHVALSVAGAMIAGPVAIFAAAFQIVAHGVAKASMFFTVGAVEALTNRTKASELVGLGKRMPWAFAAFGLAALSVSGCPPLAGAWSLLWLVAGAEKAGLMWSVWPLLACSALSLAAFAPVAGKALFGPAPGHPFERPDAASVLLVLPVAIGGAVSLGLLYVVDPLSRFLGVRLGP